MAIGMYGEDEDEKFRQMLGGILGNGPAPYDVTTSMEQPDAPSALSVPYMPQSAPSGMGGYTPPPAASAPQYLDHVQGHQFGAGDVAMLGGILAALLGGGKHRGEIAGSLAGQYGGAIMQNNARADQRNQQVDQFNAQLAAKDDPLARWKADQEAQYRAGSLKARDKELALQQTREDRIGAAQDAEAAIDPVEQARKIAQARADVDIATQRQKDDMTAGLREQLGVITGKQRADAGFGAPGGKPLDPSKVLRNRQAQAALDGIDAGTVDPLTGKPKLPTDEDGNPIKPKTAAQVAAGEKADLLATPFPGMKIDDNDAWRASNTTPAAREKNLKYFNGVQQVNNSLARMIKLREDNGTEILGRAKSDYDAALTAAIGGFTQIGQSGVLNGGEFARYKDFIPGIGPHLNDVMRLGGGDPTLEQLKGVQDSVKALAGDGLRSIGGSFDESVKPSGSKEKSLGTSADGGIKFSVDPEAEAKFNQGGGTRTVTMTKNGVTDTQDLTEDQIQKLKLKGWSE